MRARRFRPFVDQLDARIVLSDTTGTAVLVAPVSSPSDDSSMPGDDVDLSDSSDWNLAGDPPSDTSDPTDPSLDTDTDDTTSD